ATGPAKLSVQMVQDGVAWFGEAFGWTVLVGEPRAAAVVVSESTVPPALAPGGTRSVVVRVRNTGTHTWTASESFRLATSSGNTVAGTNAACGGYMNNPADGRVFLCQSVPPGGVHDFRFDVTAPTSGAVVLGVRMVQEGVAFFGDVRAWTLAPCVSAVSADH